MVLVQWYDYKLKWNHYNESPLYMYVCVSILRVYTLCVQVYYMRAVNEVERQRWVTALALAKAKAIKNLESGIVIVLSCGHYLYMHVIFVHAICVIL